MTVFVTQSDIQLSGPGLIGSDVAGSGVRRSKRITIGAGLTLVDGELVNSLELSGYLPLSGGTLTGDLKFTDALYDIGKSGATRPRDGFFSRNVTVGSLLTTSTIRMPDNSNVSTGGITGGSSYGLYFANNGTSLHYAHNGASIFSFGSFAPHYSGTPTTAVGGGGGGGQGGDGTSSQGAAGGGGGGQIIKALAVTTGDTITWAVGGGGAGNTDTGVGCADGGDGGPSSFTYAGTTYSAYGGTGGCSCGNAGSNVVGQGGGTTGNGDTNINGSNGAARTGNSGGVGGNSSGSGGTAGTTMINGGGGNDPGGGGGGGGRDTFGGSGAAGRVLFTYTAVASATGAKFLLNAF